MIRFCYVYSYYCLLNSSHLAFSVSQSFIATNHFFVFFVSELQLLPIYCRVILAGLTYKLQTGRQCACLYIFCTDILVTRCTRLISILFDHPCPFTGFGRTSFWYLALTVWNRLPLSISIFHTLKTSPKLAKFSCAVVYWCCQSIKS